jgi:hypothetical protein
LRSEDWKYITYPGIENERDELYFLSKDPGELNNLAQNSNYASELENMRRMLDTYKTDIGYEAPELTTLEQFCVWTKPFCRLAERIGISP